MEKEPENSVAVTSGVYAFTSIKEFDDAEKLVERIQYRMRISNGKE